jgi:hypothetical protein
MNSPRNRDQALWAITSLCLLFGGCNIFVPNAGNEDAPCNHDRQCTGDRVCVGYLCTEVSENCSDAQDCQDEDPQKLIRGEERDWGPSGFCDNDHCNFDPYAWYELDCGEFQNPDGSCYPMFERCERYEDQRFCSRQCTSHLDCQGTAGESNGSCMGRAWDNMCGNPAWTAGVGVFCGNNDDCTDLGYPDLTCLTGFDTSVPFAGLCTRQCTDDDSCDPFVATAQDRIYRCCDNPPRLVGLRLCVPQGLYDSLECQ